MQYSKTQTISTSGFTRENRKSVKSLESMQELQLLTVFNPQAVEFYRRK